MQGCYIQVFIYFKTSNDINQLLTLYVYKDILGIIEK